MIPYSQDLRKRVLDMVQRGDGSLRQIARRFLVCVSFVTRLSRTHRDTGSLEPKPHQLRKDMHSDFDGMCPRQARIPRSRSGSST
jgi:transposase